MLEKRPLVYVVILAFNGKKWLNACLESLLATDYPNFRVLIVDNASTDKSVDEVEKKFPEIEIIKNKENLGTARAKNTGSRYALKKGAEYVAILNQDIKVDKSWITELVSLAEKDSRMGILVPLQYDYVKNNELEPIFKAVYESKIKDNRFERNEEFLQTDHYIGAAVMTTKRFLEKVGLYDPFYFMYHEENDLARRGYYRGFKTVLALKSKVYHWHHFANKKTLSKKLLTLFKRAYFIYVLKDPNRPLLYNVWKYYNDIFSDKIKLHGLMNGMLSAFKNILRESKWLLYIPIITFKRFKERKVACYLGR